MNTSKKITSITSNSRFNNINDLSRVCSMNSARTNNLGKSRAAVATQSRNTSRFFTSGLVLSIAFIVLFISIIMFTFVNVKADKPLDVSMKKQYVSVEIKAGDSLWSIANENMGPGYSDVNDYIDDIEKVNNLSSNTIHEGCFLIVPKYIVVK